MRLLNKTKHSTAGLRVMLYDLAAQANISTRGVTVEIRRGSRNLHGCCFQYERRIILWLLNSNKTQDISFIWLHELAHLTNRNMKLGASGHGIKAQRQADAVAAKVLGITSKDLKWHENKWRLFSKWWHYNTKAEAQKKLRFYRDSVWGENKSIRLSAKSKRGCWRLEYKVKP